MNTKEIIERIDVEVEDGTAHPQRLDALKQVKEWLSEDMSFPEEPTMDWLKENLIAYAEDEGIEVTSRDTKKDILNKIKG